MNGMELARNFWETYRDELFSGELAPYAERAAAGLVGEGSECWGFDDETSRDHDWGPGCCIWLSREDYAEIGAELQARYDRCAARPLSGFPPRALLPPGAPKRVGVFRIEAFYVRFLPNGMPRTLDDWRKAKEISLAAVTNGEVFEDGLGRFSEIRGNLLSYYPEDLRLHRIANGCMLAAQAGQYNFGRQAARGETLAALAALAQFSDAVQQIAYALARRYKPFYKWSARGLLGLGPLGQQVHSQLENAVTLFRSGNVPATAAAIERTCEIVVEELGPQGLTTSSDPWLLVQAEQVNARVADDALRCSDLMEP